MFKQQRETRQANRRHNQLMRIASRTAAWSIGPITEEKLATLTAEFTGRVFAARNETVDASEATDYVIAALARRSITTSVKA